MHQKITVGILFGGKSAEHEVSLKTGSALAHALRSIGYNVIDIQVSSNLSAVLIEKKIEVAFIALHGRWGEDGCVQGLLECLRIPYTGSGVLASSLAMDKVMAKKIFRFYGLPVAKDLVLVKSKIGQFSEEQIPFGYHREAYFFGPSCGCSAHTRCRQ